MARIWIFGVLLMLCGCKAGTNKKSIPVLKVDMQQNGVKSTERYFENASAVFLETGEEFLLGSVDKIIREDSKLFIKDIRRKTLWAFDTTGKYNPPASLQQGLKISDQEYSRLLKEGYVTSIVNVKETPGSFFFTTFLSGMFVIRKDSSRIDFIPRLKDEKLGIFLYEMIPFEDPDNRYIAFNKTVANLKGEMALPAHRPDGFEERVRKMKEDDNPVLILYPVKLPA